MTIPIAYFVSPHGFGHATRAAAVMESLLAIEHSFSFHIYSTVPTWLFHDTLDGEFVFHETLVDVGLAQKTSLEEDLPESIRLLDNLIPFAPSVVDSLANKLIRQKCQLVICDIAPLGIAVAKAANIPSLLIENFTWDWIYEGYLPRLDSKSAESLSRLSRYLKNAFEAADFHIQTNPLCLPSAKADLTTGPIARKRKKDTTETRKQLNIPNHAKLVLITMGGIHWDYKFLDRLISHKQVQFLIPGSCDHLEHRNNLILLPHHSEFFHPDLINAVDAVIGKVGYSTIAEVYRAGVPFGYVSRPHFRESKTLVTFVEKEMPGIPLSVKQFTDGFLEPTLDKLLALPAIHRQETDAADEVAQFINRKIL